MKVLVSAYACEPLRGSEPGVGWNWSAQIARDDEVWVITRTTHREAIERALADADEPMPNFSYVDLPRWARFWKDERGGDRGQRLYAYLWQFAALRRARTLHAAHDFQLVHHLTFANVCTPALVGLLDVPFVWGPLGGGTPAPWRLWRQWSLRGLVWELARAARRWIARLDPLLWLTIRRAHVILAQNPETLQWLPARARAKASILSNAGFDARTVVPRSDEARSDEVVRAVLPAKLISLKGVGLAIRAIAEAREPRLRLEILGDGPERENLTALVRRLGVTDQVAFHGWLTQREVFASMARADILLFPSMHEEGGLAVVEGMAHGLIPIVLAKGGPPVLVGDAGITIACTDRDRIVTEMATHLRRLAADPAARALGAQRARERAASFEWRARVEAFRARLPMEAVRV